MLYVVLVVLLAAGFGGALLWDRFAGPVEIDCEVSSPRRLLEVRVWIMTTVVASLRERRYLVEFQAHEQITLIRVRRTALTWLVTVVTFPIGLAWYYLRYETDEVTITLVDSGPSTLTRFAGTVPRTIAAQIAGVQ